MKIMLHLLILFWTMLIFSCKSEIEHGKTHIDDLPDFTIDEYEPSLEHPGIFHNMKSIERMRYIVERADNNDPAYKAYLELKNDPKSKSDYVLKGPLKEIMRGTGGTAGIHEPDFQAAYLNALMWVVTQEEAHAQKAKEIMVRWAETLERIPEHNDAPLLVGFHGMHLAFALEMISHTSNIMSQEEIDKVNDMLRTIFLPWMETFYETPAYSNGNWGLAVTMAYMSLAILWDDKEMYQKAVNFVLRGNDNGAFPNYIDEETGQCQESGRDQGHAQLGIGTTGAICEIAYKQGNDLYSVYNNLVMKGYEYTAKYNIGYDDLPFKTWKDITGKYSNWTTFGSDGRGQYRSIYALAYNHYVLRKGLSMPYTKEMLDKNNWLGKFNGDGIDYDVFQFNDVDLN